MDTLSASGLYENTLVVFTADNGGETTRGASSRPLRGTKGEHFEGNTRVFTTLSGGVIERQGLFGKVREHMVSNLDWTPTLLDFAGYLHCIDEADYTWDGMSQCVMILALEKSTRDALVINVGEVELASARVMVELEGKYCKYNKSDINFLVSTSWLREQRSSSSSTAARDCVFELQRMWRTGRSSARATGSGSASASMRSRVSNHQQVLGYVTTNWVYNYQLCT